MFAVDWALSALFSNFAKAAFNVSLVANAVEVVPLEYPVKVVILFDANDGISEAAKFSPLVTKPFVS